MASPGCWESCFQSVTNRSNARILNEIHEVGDTLRRLKNIETARGISFLIDSSIASLCGSSESSDSSYESMSPDSLEDVLRGENATAIFTMQLQLMAIFSAMMGTARIFPIQFNEFAAWSCNSLSNLDCCQTIDIVKRNLLSQVNTSINACQPGLLEPACRLGYFAVTNITAGSGTRNNVTVAIINSRAHMHINEEGNYGLYSPCKNDFPIRYAIGLHRAHHDDLTRFQSRRGYHNFLSDGFTARAATNALFQCIDASCCPTGPATPVTGATTCRAALGDAGENVTVIASIPPIN